MKFVVVFPGRFQPAHRGHFSVYEQLARKFGEDNTYIATTDKQAPLTSPFSFNDKMEMWTTLGVPSSKVVKVKSPYNPQEIVQDIPDPDNTALIIAVSEKDMEGDAARFKFGNRKDGSPSFVQPYPGDGEVLKSVKDHAYIMTAPTVNFKMLGGSVRSATEIRAAYIKGNDQDRMNIIHDLYGVDDLGLKRMFDARLDTVKQTAETIREARRQINTCETHTRQKIAMLLESVKKLEQEAQGTVFKEELNEDYLSEK